VDRQVPPDASEEKKIVWYWVLNAVVALWVFLDAQKRHVELPGVWAAATFIVMALTLPFYLAKRPLIKGEVREGGPAWSFSKSFAVVWTALMLAAGINGKLAASAALAKAGVSAGHAGDAMLTGFGLAMIGGMWFIVLVAALGIGLYFRKPGSIEIASSDDSKGRT